MFSTLRCSINSKGKESIIDCSHRSANEENAGIHHTACEYCRVKKVIAISLAPRAQVIDTDSGLQLRCSGEKPCKRCAEKGFDCRYRTMPKSKRRRAATRAQKPVGARGGNNSSTLLTTESTDAESRLPPEEQHFIKGSASVNDDYIIYDLSSFDTNTPPDGANEGLIEGRNDVSRHFLDYDTMLDLYDLQTTSGSSDTLWPPMLSPSLDLITVEQDTSTMPPLSDDFTSKKDCDTTNTHVLDPKITTSAGQFQDISKPSHSGPNETDSISAISGEDSEATRFSLLSPISNGPISRPRTNHGTIDLESCIPQNLNQSCQCLEKASRLMEVWEARRYDSQNITIDSLLELQRQTSQLSHSVLACDYCSTRSSAMMLPLMLCEKLVCSSEHYNEPHLFAGVGKGRLGEFDIRTTQEWAHVVRALAKLQWKATRELIQRYRAVAQSAGWQTQLAILINIEERFHAIVQSEGGP